MLVPTVDVVFADVAQPDQARIVALNSKLFLKQGGGLLISVRLGSNASFHIATSRAKLHIQTHDVLIENSDQSIVYRFHGFSGGCLPE